MKNLIITATSSILLLASCTPKDTFDPNEKTPANITVTLIENGQSNIISTNHPKKKPVTRSCPAGTTKSSASSVTSVANFDKLDAYIFDGNYPVTFSIASSDKGSGIMRIEVGLLSDDNSGTAITNPTPASADLSYRAPQDSGGGNYSINEVVDPAVRTTSHSISFDFNPASQNRFIWLNVYAYDVNGNYANQGIILGHQTDFCQ